MLAARRWGPIALVLVLCLSTPADAHRRHVVRRDGDAFDRDGACDGTCTFRLWDNCQRCFIVDVCDVPDYCHGLTLLVQVPRSVAVPSRKVSRLRAIVNGKAFVFKCRVARSSCIKPSVPDDLIGNWRVDTPIATDSDCPAGLPLYFESLFSISQFYSGNDQLLALGSTAIYQPFVPVAGSFVLLPGGGYFYDAFALCPESTVTRVDIAIEATRPDATGRIALQQVVTYSADSCTPCTMRWTGTASRYAYP